MSTARRGRSAPTTWRKTSLVLIVAALVLCVIGLPPAHAAPRGEYAGLLAFHLSGFSPLVATSAGPNDFTVTGSYTNTGKHAISDLGFRFQRGDPMSGGAAIRAEAKDPTQQFAVIESDFTALPGTLKPGASTTFTATVPITGSDRTTLAITEPGVYPVMININGTVALPEGPMRARVGELHVMLSVVSVPGSTTSVPESTTTAPATDTTAPGSTTTAAAVNLMYPLVSHPHLAVGGIFANDDLAAEIGPDGRLTAAVDALASSQAEPDTVTLVVDPMLLDELNRMTSGYQVLADPSAAQPALEPRSTADAESSDTPTETVRGTGRAAAAAMLAKIRMLAARYPVIVLPYGDPDIVALVRAGMESTLATAVFRGRAIASAVLKQPLHTQDDSSHLITTIAYPPRGMLTDAAWSALKDLGYTSAVLTRSGVDDAHGRGIVTVKSGHSADTMMVTSASFADDFKPLATEGVADDWPAHLNLLAALMTDDEPSTPMVLTPSRYWTPDARGLAVMTSTLASFAHVGLLGATGPLALTSGGRPSTSTTLAYPSEAEQRELPADYLHRIALLKSDLGRLTQSLRPARTATGADPADILQPLSDALLGAASSTWRDVPDPNEPVLDTVADTIDLLYDGVHIRPSTSSYTLASSSAPLLLNIQNTLPYRVTVRVEVLGGVRVGLNVADSGPITLPDGPRTVPVKLQSTVSGSGTFTVMAQLSDADGAPWGSQVPLTITSRAYGSLTLILMIVAGGLLLIMVAFRIRQRWRNYRARTAGES